MPIACCLLPVAIPSWEGLGVGYAYCLLPIACCHIIETTGSTVKRETGCSGELKRIKRNSIESTMPNYWGIPLGFDEDIPPMAVSLRKP
ncbi:MAG: hypothetical protein HLUCCO16_03680 [Phormidium sp. OSCR]|nr:MAG: hypothetical protein HLUCCO16_03680 [Phormidium sp. OSCR]